MTGRRAVILLHWTSFLLLYLVWSTTPGAPDGLVLAFAGVAFVWTALYVIRRGPLFRPGPKLQGWTRPVHRFQHHALYLGATVLALFLLADLPSRATYIAVQLLFFAGLAHGVFHAWRHTALYDGALRTITPRALHRIL